MSRQIACPIFLCFVLAGLVEAQVEPSPPKQLAGLDLAAAAAFDVLVDEPEAGAVWAMGGDYKARFDLRGATFFPRVGREAPHEPTGFRLVEAVCGTETLSLHAEALPQLANDRRRVDFDRGLVRESFQLRHDSIEQLLTFESKPGEGDLTLRVAVEGEHQPATRDEGLELVGVRSRVGYSKAVAVDACGCRTPLGTAWAEGGILIHVDAETLAGATYPLVIDPVIQNFTVDSAPTQDSKPDIALDMSTYTYLVVWERFFSVTDRDVLALMLDRNLSPIPGSVVPIDLTTDTWVHPRVASNRFAGTFLAVANVGPTGSRDVVARLVEPLDLVPGMPITISSGLGDSHGADVGGDAALEAGTRYLVVFESGMNINGTFVDALGTQAQGAFGIGGGDQGDPSVSKSAGIGADRRWTISYRRNGLLGGDIYAAQYSTQGFFHHANTPVETLAASEGNPDVATVQEGSGEPLSVVAFERLYSGFSDINVVLMRGGTLIDSKRLALIDGSATGVARANPTVASDGETIVVAYQEFPAGGGSNIYASSFRVEDEEALVLVEGRAPMMTNFPIEVSPSMLATTDGGGSHGRFACVWNAFGNGDIVGAEYVAPPSNDTCAEATPIGLGEQRGTLVGATLEVLPGCGFLNPDPTDVWYRFTSPVTGFATARTCGTSELFGVVGGASTVLSVYDDRHCPAEPTAETCSDTSGCDVPADNAAVDFVAVAGHEYLIRVGTNWVPTQEDFLIGITVSTDVVGVSFCTCTHDAPCGNTSTTAGCVNSTGTGATLAALGTNSISAGDLVLEASGMPGGEPGILFAGNNPHSVPFFNGRRCSSGPFFRFPVRSANAAGTALEPGPGVPSIAARVDATVGQTSRFQWWFRDPAGPCGTGANYSSGFAVTWLP